MLYPSINEIKKKADSRYTLVVMAAKRSRDLIDGKPRLTQARVDKPVSIAANEIAEGLISYTRDSSAECDQDYGVEVAGNMAMGSEEKESITHQPQA